MTAKQEWFLLAISLATLANAVAGIGVQFCLDKVYKRLRDLERKQ